MDGPREVTGTSLATDGASATDRVEGLLMGLAAGDRNGGPIRMAVRLAESLVGFGGFDLDDIAARYMDWWRDGAFDTGPTAAQVFALVESGLLFPAAALQVHQEADGLTAGCNPAHRSAPLAALPNLDPQQVAEHARSEAALTHRHPLAGDTAAAVVPICGELVRGSAWDGAVRSARGGRWSETLAALAAQDPGALRSGGFGPDALALSLIHI